MKPLLLMLSVVMFFTSCKKDLQTPTSLPVDTPRKDWDQTAQAVAKDVAEKLNSLSFRKMLKHEVLLRFDGDANILLSSLINRLPKYLAYEALGNRLTGNAARGNATPRTGNRDLLANYSFDIIAEAAEAFPQMQIAVQTDAESWDPATFTPSIVYLTSKYDEATSTTVSGFDPKKNPITVSTTKDPTVNYVVISQNERTTIRNGEVRLTSPDYPVARLVNNAPYNPNDPAALLPPDDGGGGGGGGTSSHPQYVGTGQDGVLPTLIGSQMGTIVPSPTGGMVSGIAPVGTFNGKTVYRKDDRHEKMRWMRCDDIGAIEGWPAGAPEIRMHVFEQNIQNPSENLQIFKEEFKPPTRSDIDKEWWNVNGVTMHLWDWNGTGTKASFGYYEYDPVTLPNETLVAIGQITVDILTITSVIPTGTANQMTVYGSIRQTVAMGIRSLKKKNGMSEYIGKDDYSIFNDQNAFNHSPGITQLTTWPDL